MRGRKPEPTALKRLRGNPGKRALNHREPQFERSIPTCPHHLKGEARKEWRRLCKVLDTQGLLTQADRSALAAYCQAYARWIDAEKNLEVTGLVLQSDKGFFYQNPYLSIANKAIEQMVKISSEFGMTPASRTRIKVELPEEDDELEQMLFGRATSVAR